MDRRIELRQLANIITLFLIVQFGGLLLGIYASAPLQFYVTSNSTPSSSIQVAFLYVLSIAVTSILILIIFKVFKGIIVFMLLEAFAVFFGTGFLLFSILVTSLPLANVYYAAAAAGVLTLALIVAKNKKPRLTNMLAITSSIGVGVFIGFNGFFIAYLIMVVIAVYDYIAVFVTKHMIALAREVSSRNLAFLIGSRDIEAVPKSYLTGKQIHDFNVQSKKYKIKDPIAKELVRQGIIPMVSQVQLGTGDLVIPLMVAVSAYITFLSYFAAVMVIMGAAAGIIFTMYVLKRYMIALPAIPPLLVFISLSLAIYFAILNVSAYIVWLPYLAISIATFVIFMSKVRKISAVDTKT